MLYHVCHGGAAFRVKCWKKIWMTTDGLDVGPYVLSIIYAIPERGIENCGIYILRLDFTIEEAEWASRPLRE